jgi:DNA-binding CsgD family transcriptional regulator
MAFFKNRVFEISINSLTPLIWSSCRHLRTPLKNINEFPNFEKRMLSDGMTTTIHSNNGGVATFSLAVKEGTIFDRDHKLISCYLHLISSYVYERVSKIYSEFVDTTALTKREIECLQWITQGKTAWEISKIVKISERTVEFHVKNTLDKLNCSNRAQAIAKAMMLGVLANASSIFDENMQFVGTPFHRDIRYV